MSKLNSYRVHWALPKNEVELGIWKAKSEKQAALKCMRKAYPEVYKQPTRHKWFMLWVRVQKEK